MKKYIWTLWTIPWGPFPVWKLMCYALSIELVKRITGDILIYTDKRGANLLKKYKIDVPYRVIDFNIKNTEIPKFSGAKLLTMSLQEEPFVHLDHDVFLFNEQQEDPSADITVQSIETGLLFYRVYSSGYSLLKRQGVKVPEAMDLCAQNNDYSAYNCGYVSANNLDVVQEWCKIGIEMSNSYIPVNRSDNCIPEQYLLYVLAQYKQYNIKCLFSDPVFNQDESVNAGYVHLMNSKKTHYQYLTLRLLERCKQFAPKFYDSLSEDEIIQLKDYGPPKREFKGNQGKFNSFSLLLSTPDISIRNIYIQ